MIYSVKWKESHMHTYKKYSCTWPVSMIDNEEFFIFTVVFLFSSPFLWIFFRVIYYCFCTISSIHVWVKCWESFFSVLPRLSLNLLLLTVRLLVYCSGITSTLMRPRVSWAAFNVGVTLLPDICFSSSLSFIWYFSSPLLQSPSETLP